MKHAIVLAGLVGLVACSTAPQPAPTSPPPPPSAAPPPVAPGPQPPPEADACKARDFQNLVGRPRSEIPVPVRPELQRVACTTCAVTMDFNQNRLNFFFDAQTGLIKEVRCG